MTIPRLAFVAAEMAQAQAALGEMRARYGNAEFAEADVIVALGGDGFMLETLHSNMEHNLPIYGINKGTVGFLMNNDKGDHLPTRIASAELTQIYPLRMHATTGDGTTYEALAINEVSLHRQTGQAARVRISIDGKVRVDELTCDGVLVSTPAGSTAYNLSAHGPILPLNAGILALTPISAFRPRRWRGALLPREAHFRFEILEPGKRPVSVTADRLEVRDISEVTVTETRDLKLQLLFDADHNLEERILNEQFIP